MDELARRVRITKPVRDVPAEEAATWLVDLVVGGLEAVLAR